MLELTQYTKTYAELLRVRKIAIARFPRFPQKSFQDLDSIARMISSHLTVSVSKTSDEEIGNMVASCLEEGRSSIRWTTQGVVDLVVFSLFA